MPTWWGGISTEEVYELVSSIRQDLGALERRLGRIESRLNILRTQGDKEMATLQEVVAEVHRTTGLVASVRALIDGLKTQIADLAQKLADAIVNGDPEALAAVQAELDAANDAMDEACLLYTSPSPRDS